MSHQNVRDTYQKQYWEVHAHGRPWDHPVMEFFVRQRLQYLSRFVDWSKVQDFLDVGCGYGITMNYVKDRTRLRVGIDGSFAMLSRCPKDAAQFVQAHVERLPFEDNRFDCVFAWEILHHIERPLSAVQEFVRVSRRYVILFEPNRYNPAQFLFGLLVPLGTGNVAILKARSAGTGKFRGLANPAYRDRRLRFPNRMPVAWLRLFRAIPFSLPGIGISALAVGVKKN